MFSYFILFSQLNFFNFKTINSSLKKSSFDRKIHIWFQQLMWPNRWHVNPKVKPKSYCSLQGFLVITFFLKQILKILEQITYISFHIEYFCKTWNMLTKIGGDKFIGWFCSPDITRLNELEQILKKQQLCKALKP